MKTTAFRSPIAPSPSGKRNGFARHRRGQGIPNDVPTLWVKWSHLNSWQTAGNTIAVSVEVGGVTWSGFIVRICQKVYMCRGSKPAKAEDSVHVGWSYYLLPASFPALGIQKLSKKCWNTASIWWKRKGCALRIDAWTHAINWQHVLLKSRKKFVCVCLSLSLSRSLSLSLSLSPSPCEEMCWHIFDWSISPSLTFAAARVIQVSMEKMRRRAVFACSSHCICKLPQGSGHRPFASWAGDGSKPIWGTTPN